MIIRDDYSSFPVVEKLSNLTAKTVIARFEKFFSIRGICTVCRTDNGPPWNSDAMRDFAAHMGLGRLRRTMPWETAGRKFYEAC